MAARDETLAERGGAREKKKMDIFSSCLVLIHIRSSCLVATKLLINSMKYNSGKVLLRESG
jgi:hypothetical protein